MKEPAWRKGLRELILKKLHAEGALTVKQLAAACQVSEKAVAPRMSELQAEGRATDSGQRRAALGTRGRRRKVWAAVGDTKPLPSYIESSFADETEPVMRLL